MRNFNYDNDLSGFNKIKVTEEDYAIWSLWDSYDVICMQELLYNNLLEDDIYIRCIRYNNENSKDRNTYTVFKDTIVSFNALESEDISEDESEQITNELIEQIKNGYEVGLRDIVGNLIGAGSYYRFYEEGTKITELTITDDEDIVVEAERIGESILNENK